MIVTVKVGAKCPLHLARGSHYLVFGIEGCDTLYYRLVNDMGEPVLYEQRLFKVVDARLPESWVRRDYGAGEYYIDPPEATARGFYEDWHDGDAQARAAFGEVWRKLQRWQDDNAPPPSPSGGNPPRLATRRAGLPPKVSSDGQTRSSGIPKGLPGHLDSLSCSTNWPGFAHVFALGNPFGSRPFTARLELSLGEDDIAFSLGEARPDRPVRAHWRMGSDTPGDVIWTTHHRPVLVSQRVVRILQEHRFSGWAVIPVELRGKAGELLPPYFFLSIHGRSGPTEHMQREKLDTVHGARVRRVWIGVYLDPATWDGSDFFMPSGDGYRFVVEGVKQALERARVKNLRFMPLDQLETALDPCEPRFRKVSS
jgi:hypothetical protein